MELSAKFTIKRVVNIITVSCKQQLPNRKRQDIWYFFCAANIHHSNLVHPM